MLRATVHEPTATIEVEKGEIAGAMSDLFRTMFDIVRSEGMIYPIRASMMAKNGAGFLCDLQVDGKATFFATNDPPEGIVLPAHILLIDAEERTGRIVLRQCRGS